MEIEIKDCYETITCRICGKNRKSINGSHLRSHNYTTEQYKLKFDNAPTYSQSWLDSCKKAGENSHMKTTESKEKYSKMFSGEKNPSHISKTTELERQQRSPFSLEFYKLRYPELTLKEQIKMLTEKKDSIDRVISNTTLEYYTLKGYSMDEAVKMLSERQNTNSLTKLISKHGKEEGTKRWTDRNEKWQKSLHENGNLKNGYSNVSQELFNELNFSTESKCRHDTNGGEIVVGKYPLDFYVEDSNKIIEFYGDVYHANPNIYKEDTHPHPYRKELFASDIWLSDQVRTNTLSEKGYKIHIVWEQDYKVDKNKVINECLEFLKD